MYIYASISNIDIMKIDIHKQIRMHYIHIYMATSCLLQFTAGAVADVVALRVEGGGQGTAKNVETMSRRVTAIRGDKLSLHFWPPRASYRQFFLVWWSRAVAPRICAFPLMKHKHFTMFWRQQFAFARFLCILDH